MNKSIISIPRAGILLSSLRSVGYNPEAAIADIIDNSLSAKASIINIHFDWIKQQIIIADNGEGMSQSELLNSMSIGSSDPLNKRDVIDLGRFGMGMKTASFALGKKLRVLSKKDNEYSNACWDLDYVREKDKWEILIEDSSNDVICNLSNFVSQYSCGTVVCIEDLDNLISSASAAEKRKFFKMIDNIKLHLSLIFHRFLESNEISVYVNGTLLTPWNPFVPNNNARQELEQEEVIENGHRVVIKPYVLPHKTKFANDDEFNDAGGYKGWLQHQGFYVYRNRRLIIYGTWFGLFKKEMSFNLARIQLDIFSDSDFDWKIDIKKSKATPPAYADDIIRLSAENAVKRSIKVYNSRGTYSSHGVRSNSPQLSYVWEQRKDSRGVYSFRLNKKHMLLSKLKTSLNPDQVKVLNAYLNLVEKCSPIELSGVTETVGNVQNTMSQADYKEYVGQAKQLIAVLMSNDISKEEIRGLFQQVSDYSILTDKFDEIYLEVQNESE